MSTQGHGVYFVPGPPPAPPVPLDILTAQALDQRAQSLIRTNVLISLGIGLIPLPVIDTAALLGQQLYMIRGLGEIYGQRFSEDLGKKALLSLLGAMLPQSFTWKFAAFSLLKSVPLLGLQISLLATPLLAAATTYALGQIFNRHFASGGTFLSFDPVRHQRNFEQMLEEGLRMARAEQAARPMTTAQMGMYVDPVTVPSGAHVVSSEMQYGMASGTMASGVGPGMAYGTAAYGAAAVPGGVHVDSSAVIYGSAPAYGTVAPAYGMAAPAYGAAAAPGGVHVDSSAVIYGSAPAHGMAAAAAYGTAAPGGVHVDSSGVLYGVAPAATVVTHGVAPVVGQVGVAPTTHMDQTVHGQVPTTRVEAPGTTYVEHSVNVHGDVSTQAHMDAPPQTVVTGMTNWTGWGPQGAMVPTELNLAQGSQAVFLSSGPAYPGTGAGAEMASSGLIFVAVPVGTSREIPFLPHLFQGAMQAPQGFFGSTSAPLPFPWGVAFQPPSSALAQPQPPSAEPQPASVSILQPAPAAPTQPTIAPQKVQGVQAGRLSAAEDRFWYTGVGLKCLIDFAGDRPQVSTAVGQCFGFEGTASFTDPDSGELRLYGDGSMIYNGRTHQLLENGVWGAAGWSATQAVLIVPSPGPSRDKFSIFANSGLQVTYSIADLTVGANGAVVVPNRALTGPTDNPGEALCAVPHADGKSFWVLVYQGRTQLRAYRVDESGVNSTPVVSATGFGVDPNPSLGARVDKCSIVASPDWNMLALGIAGVGIAIAQIDRATGEVRNAKVRVTGSTGYGSAFSPDVTKLYYGKGRWKLGEFPKGTLEGWSATPYQLDLGSGQETEIFTLPPTDLFGYSGPRLAPNGKVYWTGQAKQALATVENPNAAGLESKFNPQGLPLGTSTMGSWNLSAQTFKLSHDAPSTTQVTIPAAPVADASSATCSPAPPPARESTPAQIDTAPAPVVIAPVVPAPEVTSAPVITAPVSPAPVVAIEPIVIAPVAPAPGLTVEPVVIAPVAPTPVVAVEPVVIAPSPVVTVEPVVTAPVVTVEPVVTAPVVTVEPVVIAPVVTVEPVVIAPVAPAPVVTVEPVVIAPAAPAPVVTVEPVVTAPVAPAPGLPPAQVVIAPVAPAPVVTVEPVVIAPAPVVTVEPVVTAPVVTVEPVVIAPAPVVTVEPVAPAPVAPAPGLAPAQVVIAPLMPTPDVTSAQVVTVPVVPAPVVTVEPVVIAPVAPAPVVTVEPVVITPVAPAPGLTPTPVAPAPIAPAPGLTVEPAIAAPLAPAPVLDVTSAQVAPAPVAQAPGLTPAPAVITPVVPAQEVTSAPVITAPVAPAPDASFAPVTATTAAGLQGRWVLGWNGSLYDMVLSQQQGNRVTGSYAWQGGTLDGTLEGNVLRLRWDQSINQQGGTAEMVIAADGMSATGSWSYNPAVYNSGLTGSGIWSFQRTTSSAAATSFSASSTSGSSTVSSGVAATGTIATTGTTAGSETSAASTVSRSESGTSVSVETLGWLTGHWNIDWNGTVYNLQMVQQGDRITGQYDWQGGTIEGTVNGVVLQLRWDQSGNRRGGSSFQIIAADGMSIAGIWNYDPTTYGSGLTGAGPWTFKRQAPIPVAAEATPVPVPQAAFYNILSGSSLVWGAQASGWALAEGQGRREYVQHVTFSGRFETPPQVFTALSALDASEGENTRIAVEAREIKEDGFDLVFATWADTKINGVGANFLVIDPAVSAVLSLSDQYAASSGDNPNWKLAEGGGERVYLQHFAFSRHFESAPVMLFGLCQLDADAVPNLRVALEARDVNPEGFDLAFKTWADTVLHGASASWLALEKGRVKALCGVAASWYGKDATWDLVQGTGERTFIEHVEFETRFDTPPRVFFGMTNLDAVRGGGTRVAIEVLNITEEGFDIRYKTWADSVTWSVGASWLALA